MKQKPRQREMAVEERWPLRGGGRLWRFDCTCQWPQARENACAQVKVGLSLTSNWLRKWRQFLSKPECSIWIPKQKRTSFDTRLEITLRRGHCKRRSFHNNRTTSVLPKTDCGSFSNRIRRLPKIIGHLQL